MKFSFRFGKRFGWNRLAPEQRAVVERVERGEISEQEAEQLLGVEVRVHELRLGNVPPPDSSEPVAAKPPPESPEDAKARELVERLAREVDEETRR